MQTQNLYTYTVYNVDWYNAINTIAFRINEFIHQVQCIVRAPIPIQLDFTVLVEGDHTIGTANGLLVRCVMGLPHSFLCFGSLVDFTPNQVWVATSVLCFVNAPIVGGHVYHEGAAESSEFKSIWTDCVFCLQSYGIKIAPYFSTLMTAWLQERNLTWPLTLLSPTGYNCC